MHHFLRLVFQLSLFAATLAVPSRFQPRDVSLKHGAQLEAISHYAAAAYCEANTRRAGQYLHCWSSNCEFAENNGWVTQSFFNIGLSNTAGFVAIDDTNQLIVVSFQGTSNIVHAFTDAAIVPISTMLCGTGDDKCLIHGGFWNAWLDVEDVVTNAVIRASTAYPSYKLVATGHSFGGALAALAATSLRNRGLIVHLYTFGQPRIGFEGISNYITNAAPKQGNNYRVTHGNDLVAQLPPNSLGGWDHFSPELHIQTDELPVDNSKIEQFDGLFNEAGNAGTEPPKGFEDILFSHSLYLGNITQCDSGARDKDADFETILQFLGVPASLL